MSEQKTTTALKLDLFRHAILIDAYITVPSFLTYERIELNLKLSGMIDSTIKIEAQLYYLVDAGYLIESASELSAGNPHFRISSKGMDYLESRGLV